MSNSESLSFARDIRPLFTDVDVAHMRPIGIDLSDRASVAEHANAILETVTAGTMPPPGTSQRWTGEMCETFKRWRDEGCQS